MILNKKILAILGIIVLVLVTVFYFDVIPLRTIDDSSTGMIDGAPSGPSTAEVGEMVIFTANFKSGPLPERWWIRWDYGDGGAQPEMWHGSSAMKVYQEPGNYDVRVQYLDGYADDGTRYAWSPVHTITVIDPDVGGGDDDDNDDDTSTGYQVTINVKDKLTGKPINNANVKFHSYDNAVYQTSYDGTHTYDDISTGEHLLEIDKEGYYSYEGSFDIERKTTINIQLMPIDDDSDADKPIVETPGFEILTLITSLAVAVFLIKRRR